jgi:two-component system response regulator PilR (NtrC family)
MMKSNTSTKTRILIVDDEPSMREFLEIMLEKEGYEVTAASNGLEAIKQCKRTPFDLVITDIKMPKVNGMEVLHKIRELNPNTRVIMITAFANLEGAIESMKEGAYDYITKPFKIEDIKLAIENALKSKEAGIHWEKIGRKYEFGEIICRSPEMLRILDLIPKVASSKSNMLITGESGTGKELVAKAIHYCSSRDSKPFVAINCGGIPETLLESELFGHKKGSFTGAHTDKIGLFEAANGGTIFLDEVGELPLSLQVKLLRVVQEKSFKPIGGTEEKVVDVRIISATNQDLEKRVIRGRFREDLYYRINVIQIRIPPLRERREDISLLAQYFLEKYSREMKKDIKRISSYAMESLINYSFPGNVRELENIIERSVALETSSIVLPESLTLSDFKEGKVKKMEEFLEIEIPPQGINLDEMIDEIEKNLVVKAFERSNGITWKAAELLHITPRSMRYRLRKHQITFAEDSDQEVERKK